MKPEELLFSTRVAHANSEEDCPVIFFTTLETWQKDRESCVAVTGKDFPEGILAACGVSPDEITEGQFLLEYPEKPLSVVIAALKQAGFQQDPAFDAFIADDTKP